MRHYKKYTTKKKISLSADFFACAKPAATPTQKPPRCAPAEKKPRRSTCGGVPKNPRRFRPKTGRRRSVAAPQEKARPRRGKIRRPAAVLPKTKKRAALGAPLTIVVKIIFWSAFQSVPRTPCRAFLTPCGAFLCGGLAPRSHGGRTSAPRKHRRPIGGFAACRTAGEKSAALPGKFCRSFPRKQKSGLPSVLSLTIIVKNHISGGVPKHTPPGFFNPLRCFSLRRACPTQPRREDFRTPQAPPPNRQLCGLPPAGEKSAAPP